MQPDNNNSNQPEQATAPVAPPVSASQSPAPTSAAQFRKAAQERNEGALITLSSGNVVRIARPSVGKLIKTGQLPSELANAAIKVQAGGNTSTQDLDKFMQYQERLVSLALLSPKIAENPNYDNDEIALDDLADDEQTEILLYVNGGLDALAKFRQQRQSVSAGPDLS